MSKLDVMGFDCFQMAAIKRNLQTLKPLLKKIKKLQTIADETAKELEALKQEAAESDGYTKTLSKRVTGYELTSAQAVAIHNSKDLNAWNELKNHLEATLKEDNHKEADNADIVVKNEPTGDAFDRGECPKPVDEKELYDDHKENSLKTPSK